MRGPGRLPARPLLPYAPCLQLMQSHHLRSPSCLGSCRGGSAERVGVWKDRRGQGPALPTTHKLRTLDGSLGCPVNTGVVLTSPESPPPGRSRGWGGAPTDRAGLRDGAASLRNPTVGADS